MSLHKNDVVECDIESLAFGGRGVAKVDGMAVFVEGGLPGDTVRARIVKAKKRFAEAAAEAVVKASPHRVDPVCAHFGQCGGCAFQDLGYAEQLAQKAAQVENALARIGGVDAPVMEDPVPSPAIWNYRNKMEFVFEQRDDGLHLGLRRKQPGQSGLPPVLDIDECHLCDGWDVSIMAAVRHFCRESGVQAYDPKTGTGYWRHLVVRHTSMGEVMVHLVTVDDDRKDSLIRTLGQLFLEQFPEMASFVHSVRTRRSIQAFGDRVAHRMGQKFVEERLTAGEREIRYHLGPNSFFQTNSAGASELFGCVAEYGAFTGSEILLDLYCGAGAIGIFVADRVQRVVGYEISEESVAKAWASAKLNRASNCEFVQASLDQGVDDLRSLPKPDVIVTDPPRSGMSQQTADDILALSPQKIIAVSCDPATLARDVKRLSERYALTRARAVDMFPHTHHVETVALLERKTGA